MKQLLCLRIAFQYLNIGIVDIAEMKQLYLWTERKVFFSSSYLISWSSYM